MDKEIEQKLTDYTIAHSNYDEKRNYIGLSKIVEPVEKIIEHYQKGMFATDREKLKCYKGYQMEADLVLRLKKIYGNRIQLGKEKEIVAYNGNVKGHPDVWLDEISVDAKSFLKDEWLPKPKENLPSRIFWQMQGYMLYSNTDCSYVIFESRESGIIVCRKVLPYPKVQKQIDDKIKQALHELGLLSL